ncbi:MAG: hypothetical protein K8R37_14070 [Bacteroidales bacterium]|nr:hypothetical protein [Bacteroidales bacterium]
MNEEKSGNFLCPKCKKRELEYLEWGFKCKNCGYEIQKNIKKDWTISMKIRALLTTILWSPFYLFYIIPIFVYFFVLFVICGYIITDVYSIMTSSFYIFDFSHENNDNIILLSRLILYIILSLALLDLTGLISNQYLAPAVNYFTKVIKYIKYGDNQTRIELSHELLKKESDRNYISKVIIISVILILMHTFYELFESPTTTFALAALIFSSLLGAAAVLIAVGLWKKYDSWTE